MIIPHSLDGSAQPDSDKYGEYGRLPIWGTENYEECLVAAGG